MNEMIRNITTVVGGKTFVAKFHDYIGDFINDFLLNKNNELTSNQERKIDEHNKNSRYIGKIAKLAVDNLKLEPTATIVLPEKYGKEFFDEYKAWPEFLMAMFGGGMSYKPWKPELADELSALEFTVIDLFPSPGGEDLFFKVVRNDNPEILFWIYADSFEQIEETNDTDNIADPRD